MVGKNLTNKHLNFTFTSIGELQSTRQQCSEAEQQWYLQTSVESAMSIAHHKACQAHTHKHVAHLRTGHRLACLTTCLQSFSTIVVSSLQEKWENSVALIQPLESLSTFPPKSKTRLPFTTKSHFVFVSSALSPWGWLLLIQYSPTYCLGGHPTSMSLVELQNRDETVSKNLLHWLCLFWTHLQRCNISQSTAQAHSM